MDKLFFFVVNISVILKDNISVMLKDNININVILFNKVKKVESILWLIEY